MYFEPRMHQNADFSFKIANFAEFSTPGVHSERGNQFPHPPPLLPLTLGCPAEFSKKYKGMEDGQRRLPKPTNGSTDYVNKWTILVSV